METISSNLATEPITRSDIKKVELSDIELTCWVIYTFYRHPKKLTHQFVCNFLEQLHPHEWPKNSRILINKDKIKEILETLSKHHCTKWTGSFEPGHENEISYIWSIRLDAEGKIYHQC